MKTFIMLSIGLAALRLMRRRSASARHWILAVTIACAAGLPLLAPIAPAWRWHRPAEPRTAVDDRTGLVAGSRAADGEVAIGVVGPAVRPTAPLPRESQPIHSNRSSPIRRSSSGLSDKGRHSRR